MRDACGGRAPSHALCPFAAVRTFYVFRVYMVKLSRSTVDFSSENLTRREWANMIRIQVNCKYSLY